VGGFDSAISAGDDDSIAPAGFPHTKHAALRRAAELRMAGLVAQGMPTRATPGLLLISYRKRERHAPV
jgi:hypothetical protein